MLDRFIEFETVADPSAAPGGAPAGGDPSQTAEAPEPGGEAVPSPPAAATEPAPAAPPSWQDDPAFLDAVDDRALQLMEQRFGPILEQLRGGEQPQAQQQPQLLLPPDPYTSENFPEEFAAYQAQQNELQLARIEEMFGRVAQPIEQQQNAARIAEGTARLQDMVADDVARNGDLVESAKAQIIPLAERLFEDVKQRYGDGPRTAEIAIAQAAQILRGIDAEAREKAITVHQNHLATLAGAPGEPGSAGGGVATLGDAPLGARELALKYGRSAAALRVGTSATG